MACIDGNCSNAWQDLCAYVGQTCIDLKTVMSGLINNQNTLRSKVEYYDERVTDFDSCIMLYIDVDACSVVTVPTDSTIPYGSHIGGGWVQTTGNVICTRVTTATGVEATACTPLDFDMVEITDDDSPYAYTLSAPVGDCTPVLIGCPCPVEDPVEPVRGFDYEFYGLTFDSLEVPVNGAANTVLPNLSITIPEDGYYFIRANSNAHGTNSPILRVVSSVVSANTGNMLFTDDTYYSTTIGSSYNLTAERCLAAGDVITWEFKTDTNGGVAVDGYFIEDALLAYRRIEDC